MKVKSKTKYKLCNTYTTFLKYKNLKWEKPSYQQEKYIPFIPTEQEIDILIASCRSKMSTVLQLLKETGARIGEAQMLTWIDFDLERKTVNIKPEKGSNPRILPISDKLIGMLNKLPRNKENILPKWSASFRHTYDKHRTKTAEKLQNPRLNKISFHTFRHWKATTEYHKTKDIIHVKYILGHKQIETTMVYINLEQAIFLADTDEWTTKVSHTIEEETQLINAGFQLVRSINETTAIYKKRK